MPTGVSRSAHYPPPFCRPCIPCTLILVSCLSFDSAFPTIAQYYIELRLHRAACRHYAAWKRQRPSLLAGTRRPAFNLAQRQQRSYIPHPWTTHAATSIPYHSAGLLPSLIYCPTPHGVVPTPLARPVRSTFCILNSVILALVYIRSSNSPALPQLTTLHLEPHNITPLDRGLYTPENTRRLIRYNLAFIDISAPFLRSISYPIGCVAFPLRQVTETACTLIPGSWLC